MIYENEKIERQIIDIYNKRPNTTMAELLQEVNIGNNKAHKTVRRMRMEGTIAEYEQDTPVQSAILDLLKSGPKPRKAIIEATGFSEKAIEKAVVKMSDKKLIRSKNRLWYLIKKRQPRNVQQ